VSDCQGYGILEDGNGEQSHKVYKYFSKDPLVNPRYVDEYDNILAYGA